jgi:hypothetical protein
MAFNLNNLLSTLDSSIGLLDSSSDLLSILQAINVTNPTKGYGKSQKKTYATRASLPAASVSLRGSLAVVQVIGNWEASGNVDNGLYVCTGNDWALVQGLDSAEIGPVFQGSNYGYISGGQVIAGYPDAVERFSFTSDGGGTDVGNLFAGRYSCSGQSSSTHAYTSGGIGSGGNVIDKFPFTSGFTTATDVGNLTGSRDRPAGQSSIPYGYGYTTGGGNVIEKFSFSSDGDATVAGNTLTSRSFGAGQSSTTHGYTSGNYPYTTDIDKFPFSSDGNSTDVGDLTVARGGAAGQSSATHGYTSGGATGPGDPNRNNTIDKFPFASNGNATDVGDLSVTRNANAGQSSTTHGYTAGGYQPAPVGASNVIDKFPFASDFSGNATDVGNLAGLWGRYYGAGQQY